jgi:hypothetical protein
MEHKRGWTASTKVEHGSGSRHPYGINRFHVFSPYTCIKENLVYNSTNLQKNRVQNRDLLWSIDAIIMKLYFLISPRAFSTASLTLIPGLTMM